MSVEIANIQRRDIINGGEKETEETFSDNNNIQCFARFSFQITLIVITVRLVVYLSKLYLDISAVRVYYGHNNIDHFVVAVIAVFLPSIMHILYLFCTNFKHDDDMVIVICQLKSYYSLFCFVTRHLCSFRRPDTTEKIEISRLRRNAERLEFFQYFYSGFLHIILQLHITSVKSDSFLCNQFISSIICVTFALISCQIKSDDVCTKLLSLTGQISMIISRLVVIILTLSLFHFYSLILLALHVTTIAVWFYRVSQRTYNVHTPTSVRHVWSARNKLNTALNLTICFGIPSLLIWPNLFDLNKHCKLCTFLSIIIGENSFLCAFWYINRHYSTLNDANVSLVIAVLVCVTLIAVLFLGFYATIKQKNTDFMELCRVRRMNESEAECFGIYYYFYEHAFTLPDTVEYERRLSLVRDIRIRQSLKNFVPNNQRDISYISQ